MFSKEIYINRRNQLKSFVGSGIILLIGNEQSSMSFKDNWYPFRQDSSFLYFTGLDTPALAAIIDVDNNTEIIFGEESGVDDIIWNGHTPSLKEMAELSGCSTTKSFNELKSFVKNAADRHQSIHYLPPYRPEQGLLLSHLLSTPLTGVDAGVSTILIQAIVSLRSIKGKEEVEEIKKAVAISEALHLTGMRESRAGLTEAHVAGLVQSVAISGGGNLSFPTILTTHGEILHNHYGNHILPPGKMVLLDAGAETAMHYAGDLTRTFPVDAAFTSLQKDVYNIVLNALQTAAAAVQPGKLFKDIHLLAATKLTEGLTALGLMKGDAKEAVAAGAHTLFFQCGLGHMMGLDVHDMENLGEQYVGYTPEMKKSTEFGLKSLRLGKALEAGYVVTVEPGLYFIPELMDIWAAEKKLSQFINYDQLPAFRDFGGIRIEDDYLVTPTGSELLSTSLPRTVTEIEAIRQKALA
ncbi:aminopeptidase P family protein [Ferruginibacter paludis]|uniref:aminopeptidase P family protein n=1 Tax=Ferruginibacter paludis TaxID=1310417 RepID=UPI0025B50AD9|nr:aminopeptidase P family protein [Ferruginibacter paludis]MDN3657131.1 aminopeptidase P family protein [Ferruginibacter paludis]